jgi:hypothetical protein
MTSSILQRAVVDGEIYRGLAHKSGRMLGRDSMTVMGE